MRLHRPLRAARCTCDGLASGDPGGDSGGPSLDGPGRRRERARQDRGRAGFSLVELAIVIAIIGVLAVIAAPSFIDMQLRAKRAEAEANIDGIDKSMLMAVQGHPDFQEHDFALWTADYAPRDIRGLDKTAVPWVVPPRGRTIDFPGFRRRFGADAWAELGFQPDGQVRCIYSFIILQANVVNRLATVTCDLDGDRIMYERTLSRITRAGTTIENDTVLPGPDEY